MVLLPTAAEVRECSALLRRVGTASMEGTKVVEVLGHSQSQARGRALGAVRRLGQTAVIVACGGA